MRPGVADGSRLSRPDHGFSLLEVLIATGIFLMILVGVVRLQTQVNLPQQEMIRNYSLVMGVCKRFINGLIEDILKGDPPPESPGGHEQDVTEAVLESGSSLREFRKFFLGGAGQKTTSLAMNFKAHLLVKDLGRHLGSDVGSANGQYFLLQIRCRWGPDMKHTYSLRTMAKRR